jgi:hypothetical protein
VQKPQREPSRTFPPLCTKAGRGRRRHSCLPLPSPTYRVTSQSSLHVPPSYRPGAAAASLLPPSGCLEPIEPRGPPMGAFTHPGEREKQLKNERISRPGCFQACYEIIRGVGGWSVSLALNLQYCISQEKRLFFGRFAPVLHFFGTGPPMGTSKHCCAGATTGNNATLCPPAAPALGREFRLKKRR